MRKKQAGVGWVILDKGRQYINVVYDTERQARQELEDLLRPYPPGHEWRLCLTVNSVCDVLVLPGEPPYGAQYEKSRHGLHIVPNTQEQRIIRLVLRLFSMGMPIAQIALRLDAREMRPRHSYKFTKALVEEVIQQERPDEVLHYEVAPRVRHHCGGGDGHTEAGEGAS